MHRLLCLLGFLSALHGPLYAENPSTEPLSLEDALAKHQCSYRIDPVVFQIDSEPKDEELCYGEITCNVGTSTLLYPMLCPAMSATQCPSAEACYAKALAQNIQNEYRPTISKRNSGSRDKYGRRCKFSGPTAGPTLFYVPHRKLRMCVGAIDCGKDAAGPNLHAVGCLAQEEKKGKKKSISCPDVVGCVRNELEALLSTVSDTPATPPATREAPPIEAPTNPPARKKSLYEYLTEDVFK